MVAGYSRTMEFCTTNKILGKDREIQRVDDIKRAINA